MKVIGFYLLCLAFSSSLFSQKYIPKSDGELIYHKYYTLSYNEYHEQANWVHYKLNPTFFSLLMEYCWKILNKKSATSCETIYYGFIKYSRRDLNPHAQKSTGF